MGNEQVTVINSEVIKVDTDKQQLWLKGAVPGAYKSLVVLRAIGKLKTKSVKDEK